MVKISLFCSVKIVPVSFKMCKYLLENKQILNFRTMLVVFVLLFIPRTQASYRYTMDSCSDLVPKRAQDLPENYDSHHQEPNPGWRNDRGGGSGKRKVRSDSYVNEVPIRITAPGRRYRRNSDVYVHVESKTFYDSIMLQGRAVNPSGEFINGGVGLVGRFEPHRLDRHNFSYLECFRESYSTILDRGFARLGNVTFTWTAPDSDKGRVRFLAGITKGSNYWVLVSNILEFNPYPVSTVQCGGTDACFRVCPLDYWPRGACTAYDSLMMYSYSTEIVGKREVEFTLGGRVSTKRETYIAIAYTEDNDNLYQADITACFLENGKAKLEHYLLEVVGAPLLKHQEEITLDDYDYDGNMLWCRFRRQISFNHNSVIHPWKTFYNLLYRGSLNPNGYPKLQSPSRHSMFSSDERINLTTPINKIYSGSSRPSYSLLCQGSLWIAFFALSSHIG